MQYESYPADSSESSRKTFNMLTYNEGGRIDPAASGTSTRFSDLTTFISLIDISWLKIKTGASSLKLLNLPPEAHNSFVEMIFIIFPGG